MNVQENDYAIRYHTRLSEDDPHTATVMYSMSGVEGPWFDMVSGEIGYCNEVLDALILARDIQSEDRQ